MLYEVITGGASEVEEAMKEMKIEIMREPLRAQYVPTPEMLEACREAGRQMGRYAEQFART